MAKLNNTLEEITNSYSLFKENQVLTATQLNQVVRYFDDQDRLTRTLGIGVGLICGFEVAFDQGTGTIDISKGCGITTDGDLLYWDDLYSFDRYRLFDDEKAEYPYFTTEAGKMRLWELFGTESEQEGLTSISSWAEKDETGGSINYGDLAVIAYLENYQKEPDTCTELDCDNQGIQVLRNLKFLLIEKSNLNYIIESFDTIFNKYKKVNNAQSKLPRIKIERIILNGLNTESESSLYVAYASAVNRLRAKLKSGLETLYMNYSGLLDPSNTVSMTAWSVKLEALMKLNLNQTIKWFQYRFDWAKDIVNTYLELREALQRLEKECCPNPTAFPKHLMLSELILTTKLPEYRHGFYPSPAVSRESETLLKAKFLFARINQQILNFSLTGVSEVKITPSKLHHGQYAIPYYYDTLKVYDQWNFELSKTGRDDENLSYFASKYVGTPPDDTVLNPLKYDIDQYDFFRIEGHIGMDYAQAIKEIKAKVTSSGLPVDVVALRLGSLAETLNLDDYKCYFEDLEVMLKAWEVELNCLMRVLARFFSGFKLDSAGTHFEYPLGARAVGSSAFAKATETGAVFTEKAASRETIAFAAAKETYSAIPGYTDKITYKVDTTVRDNVVTEADTLGIVLDKVFKENPTGSENDIINETYKELKVAYDIDSWDSTQKEIAVDIPLNIIAVANDIGKYKPGDLGLIEEVDVVSEFEKRLNALCKQASGWNSRVNTYFTRAEYVKIGYEEKYLQILGELAQSCCSAEKLQILREEITKRKEEILENTLLAKYAEKHPGLDHLGGVPKGGTFVLVYKDEKQSVASNERITEVVALARNTPATELAVREAVTAKTAGRTAVFSEAKAVSAASSVELLGVADYTTSIDYIGRIADLYKEALGLQKGIVTEDSNLPGFTVVADFYLPYTCCSDCPPMSFIIPRERVSLRLPVEFICLGDEGAEVIPFEVFPDDGIVASDIGGEAVVAQDGGGYVFDASKLPAEHYGKTIHFTVNDQQTDTTLVVFEAVQASFTVPEANIRCFQEKGVAIVKFNNTTPLQPGSTLSYQWEFGDDTVGNERFERDPVHEYRLNEIEQPLKITLKVTNGRCATFAEESITICEVTSDPCLKLSLEKISVLATKIEKYDPQSFGNFIVLLETTIELNKKIIDLGEEVFVMDAQVDMLKNLKNLNWETFDAIHKVPDDVKQMMVLGQLYLDQLMLMLDLLGCNWTEEGFGNEIMTHFTEFVVSQISFLLEVVEGISESDFAGLLEAYINESPKVPDEFMEILKRILEMFKR
jgi:hypothetical protein